MAAENFIVMTSGAFTAAHLALVPEIEKLTNKKVVTATTSVGTGETSIASRLARGEVADLVIVAAPLQQQFVDQGLVLAEGCRTVASSTMGFAVRAGAPKPDVATLEGLKKTLLEAKAIAYSASVSGQYFTTELVQRLGIADQVLPRSRLITGGERTGAVVARGDADLAFQQISELMPVQGIDHITPLPPEAQRTTEFKAGVGANSTDRELARTVIDFLASAQAAEVVRKTGLQPAN